jgi:serine/threonine protein kinase
MLSFLDLKSGVPNWTILQHTAIDSAFRVQDFLGGDERSAVFTAKASADPDSKAVIRLYAMTDESAAEKQIALWLSAQELVHPNLVRILGAGRVAAGDDSLIYVALEPADERLASVLSERRLEPDEAAEILKSTVNALERLHSAGFVHGVVSPEQIFAVGDAIKLSAENMRHTGSHYEVLADAPKFLAPESNRINITAAADVWCLGATLYECLTQEKPDGSEFHHTNLPEPYRAILRRALDPDPQQRGTLAEIGDLQSGKKPEIETPEPIMKPEPAAKSEPLAPASTPINVASVSVDPPRERKEPVARATNSAPSPRPSIEPRRAEPKPSGFPVWAYGAGILVVIVALVLLLRPKHPDNKVAQVAPSAVPSAQQKVIPPASESRENKQSTRPQAKPSNAAPAPVAATAPGTALKGNVWRVVVYTYNGRGDAEQRAQAINKRHPNLRAEVFSSDGNAAPYLVVVGGAMTRDEAKRFRRVAVSSGMPRDSYTQNFSH